MIAGVATKTTLVDLAIWSPVEGKTHVFQVNHSVNSFFCQNLCCVLVYEVVATFNGVEGVPFPAVFFHVGQSCSHTALRCTGV